MSSYMDYNQLSGQSNMFLSQQDNFFAKYQTIVNDKRIFGCMFTYFNNIKQNIKNSGLHDKNGYNQLKTNLGLFKSQLNKQRQQFEMYIQQCNELEAFYNIVNTYLTNWTQNISFSQVINQHCQKDSDIAMNNSIRPDANTLSQSYNHTSTCKLQTFEIDNAFQKTMKEIQSEVQHFLAEQQKINQDSQSIATDSKQEEIKQVEQRVIDLQQQLNSGIDHISQILNNNKMVDEDAENQNESDNATQTAPDKNTLSLLDQLMYVYKNVSVFNKIVEKNDKIDQMQELYTQKEEEVTKLKERLNQLENYLKTLEDQNVSTNDAQDRQPDQQPVPNEIQNMESADLKQSELVEQNYENMEQGQQSGQFEQEPYQLQKLMQSKVDVSQIIVKHKKSIEDQKQKLEELNKKVDENEDKINQQAKSIEDLKLIFNKMEQKYQEKQEKVEDDVKQVQNDEIQSEAKQNEVEAEREKLDDPEPHEEKEEENKQQQSDEHIDQKEQHQETIHEEQVEKTTENDKENPDNENDKTNTIQNNDE